MIISPPPQKKNKTQKHKNTKTNKQTKQAMQGQDHSIVLILAPALIKSMKDQARGASLHNYISLRCEDHIISLFPYLRCEDLIIILKPSRTPSSHPSSHAFLFLIFSALETKISLNIFPLSLYIHPNIYLPLTHLSSTMFWRVLYKRRIRSFEKKFLCILLACRAFGIKAAHCLKQPWWTFYNFGRVTSCESRKASTFEASPLGWVEPFRKCLGFEWIHQTGGELTLSEVFRNDETKTLISLPAFLRT